MESVGAIWRPSLIKSHETHNQVANANVPRQPWHPLLQYNMNQPLNPFPFEADYLHYPKPWQGLWDCATHRCARP